MSIVPAILFVAKLLVCAACASAGALWILSAWFDRRLRTWEAALLGVGLLVLMFLGAPAIMRSRTAFVALAVAVIGGTLLLRAAAVGADRRLRKQLDDDDIHKYHVAVHEHPDNPYAHSLLADAYRKAGELALAAAEYEAALRIDPSLKQERHWLQWLQTKLPGGEPAATPGDGPEVKSPPATPPGPTRHGPSAQMETADGRWRTGTPGEKREGGEASQRSSDPRPGARLGDGGDDSEQETERQTYDTHA